MADKDCTTVTVYSLDPIDLARFWSKVLVSGVTECWPWEGYIREDGTGQFKTPEGTKQSHRIAYQLVNGEIPPGLVVRHTCDNPTCCNPYHLLSGTHADNVSDRVLRNRSAVGERNGRAVLTEADVIKILDDPRVSNQIGIDYGVDGATIRAIKTGKTWKTLQERLGRTTGHDPATPGSTDRCSTN